MVIENDRSPNDSERATACEEKCVPDAKLPMAEVAQVIHRLRIAAVNDVAPPISTAEIESVLRTVGVANNFEDCSRLRRALAVAAKKYLIE